MMASPPSHVSFGSGSGGRESLGILSPVNEQRLVAGVAAILASQWSRRLLLLAVFFFAWLTLVLSSFLMLPRVHTLQAIHRNKLRKESQAHRASGLFGSKGVAFPREGNREYSKLHDTVTRSRNTIGNKGIIGSGSAPGVAGGNLGIDERNREYNARVQTERGFAIEIKTQNLTGSGSSSSSNDNHDSSDPADVSREDGDTINSDSNGGSGVDRISSSSSRGNVAEDVNVDEEQLKQELLQDGAVEDDELAGISDLAADMDEPDWGKVAGGNEDQSTRSLSAGLDANGEGSAGSALTSSGKSDAIGGEQSSSSSSSGIGSDSGSGSSGFFPREDLEQQQQQQQQQQQRSTAIVISGSLDNSELSNAAAAGTSAGSSAAADAASTASDLPLDAAAAGAAASLADEESEEEEAGEGEGEGEGEAEDEDMDLSYDSEDELEVVLLLRIPRNMGELRAVRATLALYKREFPLRVVIIFINLYLFLQSFCIPGSICLNLLAGSLFGFFPGLLTICVLITVGACTSYTISHFLLRDIVYYYFPDRCDWMRAEVQRHYTYLVYYVISLRITPIMPTWVVNLCSPLVGIPIRIYVVGTFFGFIPSNIIQAKAGCVLSTINSLSDLYDAQTIAVLFLVATIALLPPLSKTLWAQRLWAHIMSNAAAAACVSFISSLGATNSGGSRVVYTPLRAHYSGIGSHSVGNGGSNGCVSIGGISSNGGGNSMVGQLDGMEAGIRPLAGSRVASGGSHVQSPR